MFSPEGVRTRAIPHLGVIAHCAFYGSEVIDIIINQEGVADRRTAIEIAQELLTLGVIHSIEPQVRTVVDDRKAIYQCRHARLRDDGAVELDGDDEVHMRVGWVHMTMAMDMEDLQSLDFWTKLVYVKQVDKGFRYDIRCVTHPLAGIVPTNGKRLDIINFDSCDAEHEEGIDVENGQIQGTEEDHSNASEALLQADDISTDVSEESNIVQSIVVQTVLPSKTRPMVLGLQKLVEDGSLHKERQYINLAPSILVKPGANLMQDACIQIMFQCFNSIWDSCSVFKETHGGVIPFCASCEVFPTSSSNGFVEVQTGLASMKRFDWRAWRDRYGEHAERVNDMLRSAAGSYIGTYILGYVTLSILSMSNSYLCRHLSIVLTFDPFFFFLILFFFANRGRDRNFDNVLVKDWRYVLHMDFSYVLGRMPPVDVPSISLALDMEKAFREINVWEKFVNMAVDAYIALRQNAGMLKHVAKLLFTKAGYTGEEVSDFLDGKKSLNVQCAEGEAGETIRNLLMKSATDVSQWFQEFNHDTVIPIWFDLIKKGFPPVEMVMSFMDAVEESQATPVVGADEVEIDEDEIVEVM